MKNISRLIKYVIIVGAFLIFCFIALETFGKEESTTEELKGKIVLISHVYSNPYWQYVKAGAEEAAKENDFIVEYQGPDYASVEEGIMLINMASAAKVQGIISYVQDGKKYNSTINKVVENGIPIITLDSDAEESKRLAYVGTDNIEAGRIAAQEMIKLIGTEGNVGIIMGGLETKNQLERVMGFKEYLCENSKIKIIATASSDSYLLEAELAAKKIVTENTNIDALFCTSAQDGIGASKTLINLGISEEIKIICFDDLPETLAALERGEINTIIAQDPYEMGYNSVSLIIDIIKGEKVTEINSTAIKVITRDNLDEYMENRAIGYGEQ